jgi:hypothetical protein
MRQKCCRVFYCFFLFKKAVNRFLFAFAGRGNLLVSNKYVNIC